MLLIEARDDKLDDHYEGPYKINTILNNVNLELRLSPQETGIVHMNCVKQTIRVLLLNK